MNQAANGGTETLRSRLLAAGGPKSARAQADAAQLVRDDRRVEVAEQRLKGGCLENWPIPLHVAT